MSLQDVGEWGSPEPFPLLRCELQIWHEGPHADQVWDEWGCDPVVALWARWDEGIPVRCEPVPWCEPGDNVACDFFRDHFGEHSWNVHDPEWEALAERVAEQADFLDRVSLRAPAPVVDIRDFAARRNRDRDA
ncbi:hypothetical protein [Streptomyces sp. SCSIO ZS0520]|uniref:hypothetical protein n=1 Tax=Streptomyces sp. SCSIO ZS0520 TaxID=2892996 RepID=UPI0021DA9368|nr:hypothetical protein [Streptomyces sp. SCSIO ZS0520]